MTNLVCTSKSNYFRVKDEATFLAWANDHDVRVSKGSDGRYCLLGTEEGLWPCGHPDGEFIDLLPNHLADGEVAVLMQTGAEGLRGLVGWAVAVHSDGRTVYLGLEEIYTRAEQRFGVRPTPAEY